MINLNLITNRQKLTIAKGLCDYDYIMKHQAITNKDFEEVYYNFYLKARWAIMKKPKNSIPYFKRLAITTSSDNLMTILDDLYSNMSSSSYEFSLASKLLHTKNPSSPIYDKKVREYLSNEEGVDFWWQNSPKKCGALKGITSRQKIQHDWNELNNWYASFLPSQRGKQWVQWFDTNFPQYASISDVKKIDFIIFSTR